MAIKRGTSKRDVLSGTSGNDKLFGLGGNDTLTGKSGNDLLDGGTGADRMTGGLGNDTYIVDNTGDRTIEASNQGTDTVKSSVTHTLGANLEHLILTGTKAINGTLSSSTNEIGNSLTGNSKANVLNGGLGHDVLVGGLGGDTLNGGNGDDTLIPGAGNGVGDVINGGAGYDTVDYRDAASGVYVDLQSNLKGGAATGDTFAGLENVVGSAFRDVLLASNVSTGDKPFAFGGGGNDDVYASTFSYDRIRGDDGFDVLIGDPGSTDDFWLQYDRGMDFVQGFKEGGLLDNIYIDHAEFNLSTTPNTFITDAEFEADVFAGIPVFELSERLIFDTDTNTLWADKDGPGSAFSAVPIAQFADGFEPGLSNIFVF